MPFKLAQSPQEDHHEGCDPRVGRRRAGGYPSWLSPAWRQRCLASGSWPVGHDDSPRSIHGVAGGGSRSIPRTELLSCCLLLPEDGWYATALLVSTPITMVTWWFIMVNWWLIIGRFQSEDRNATALKATTHVKQNSSRQVAGPKPP